MPVYHIPCGPAVNESERKAFRFIPDRLREATEGVGSSRWHLLTNLDFCANDQHQSDEIDIVVIGPPGVQLIEVKHWTSDYVKQKEEQVRKEADLLNRKARRVGTTLRSRVKDLPHVEGVFLVTEKRSRVKSLEKRPPVHGVRFYTFETWEKAVGFHQDQVLNSSQIEDLSSFLYPQGSVDIDGTLKRLDACVELVLQTPSHERFHRIYKAKHTRRKSHVLLHLYDLSANNDLKAPEKAEREWKALQRLAEYRWAPKVVDSFQDAPGYRDEIKFFTMEDPEAPSIRERSVVDLSEWNTIERITFARDAVRALEELHSEAIDAKPTIHRNLTSKTVLVKRDNSPILSGFEHTRIPNEETVVSASIDNDWDTAVSPEIRAEGLLAADRRSDIYSLCAALLCLFEHKLDEKCQNVLEVLRLGTRDEPAMRSTLIELDVKLSEILGEPRPLPPPPEARLWIEGERISFREDDYRVIKPLGSGGVGTAYKVEKLDRVTKKPIGTYVAKVATDKEVGNRILNRYRLVHSHLRHKSLSIIFEVAPEWKNNNFVALMTYIEGQPLSDFLGRFSELVEYCEENSEETLAQKWLHMVCEALGVLHDNGLLHGDVSPSNMIVSESELVLTDYDCATKIGEPAAAPGTVIYCSPSYSQRLQATPSDDIYALASSFFHIIFSREPFQYGGERSKDRGLNWNGIRKHEFPVLTRFFSTATDPDRAKRFQNVSEALKALEAQPTMDIRSNTGTKPDMRISVEEAEVLTGIVRFVIYENKEDDFYIFEINTLGRQEVVKVLGHATSITVGEWITASGEWEEDPNHGTQFRALEGVENYIGSGMIDGIDPIYTKRILHKFQEKVFDIIVNQPERIASLEGIGQDQAEMIITAWKDQQTILEIMQFLHRYKVATTSSVRIYKTYGIDAVQIIKENSYRLIADIRGFGFRTADQIADKLGIEKESMIRIRSGISFALSEAMVDGHCGLPVSELKELAEKLLEVPADLVVGALDLELADRRLTADSVGGTDCIFLSGLHRAERMIAQELRRVAAGSLPWPYIDADKALPWVETRKGMRLAEPQSDAVRLALRSKVMVITGGPGVGKTTIVDAILRILRVKKVTVIFCAPTGRAAKRLSEATGTEAKTIHRLLEFDPTTGGFRRNEDNPLECDLLVVDESSMVDVLLMQSLTRTIPDGAAFLMVGDVDQMPPVGPGQVLADLIRSGVFPVVRLTEIFHQAAQSRIVTNAHRINAGLMPDIKQANSESDFYFVRADEPERAADLILKIVCERIPKRFGFDPVRDIQVLCPMKRGSVGANSLNTKLQKALNTSQGPSVERFGRVFAVSDKVMQIENSYEKDVYNGDIGTIEAVDLEQGGLFVLFDGRRVGYGFGELDMLVPAYATTIHESLGSEYEAVVIPLFTQNNNMLHRELLYTGITRGRKLVVLIGQHKAMEIAVKNVANRRRWSRLDACLANGNLS